MRASRCTRLHNNVVFVSRDVYTVTASTPGLAELVNGWEPEAHAPAWDVVSNFAGSKRAGEVHRAARGLCRGIDRDTGRVCVVLTRIEDETPTREPVDILVHLIGYKGRGYPDYALNGVPDFDQRQGGWQLGEQWSYDAAVAGGERGVVLRLAVRGRADHAAVHERHVSTGRELRRMG